MISFLDWIRQFVGGGCFLHLPPLKYFYIAPNKKRTSENGSPYDSVDLHIKKIINASHI